MKTVITLAAFGLVAVLNGCASSPMGGRAAANQPAPSIKTVAEQIAAREAIGMLGNRMGVTPAAAQTPKLVNILVQQLGISHQQALGGAGSIFSLAKRSMNPTSFGKVSQAVPEITQLLSAAPALGNSGGLLGAAATALGTGSELGNLAMLASSFQQLGLNSSMVSRFIPVILQYVQAQGGASTMGLLQAALMP
jgi:hypothetical protein